MSHLISVPLPSFSTVKLVSEGFVLDYDDVLSTSRGQLCGVLILRWCGVELHPLAMSHSPDRRFPPGFSGVYRTNDLPPSSILYIAILPSH